MGGERRRVADWRQQAVDAMLAEHGVAVAVCRDDRDARGHRLRGRGARQIVGSVGALVVARGQCDEERVADTWL